MENETKIPLSHKPRRASENRQKQARIIFRVTPEERATLQQAAGGSGLSVGSYIRVSLLKTAVQTRSRRRPLADVAALSMLYGQLNKIGGNINQIARAANSGESPERAALEAMRAELVDVLRAIRGAMGYAT